MLLNVLLFLWGTPTLAFVLYVINTIIKIKLNVQIYYYDEEDDDDKKNENNEK